MPTIAVPGQGDVEFPDSMGEADITAALKKLSPPPAPAQPGVVSRAFQWLSTPFKSMQPVLDANKANAAGAEPGPLDLTKDSGDTNTAFHALVSGIPGYQRNSESPEAQDRMSRFRTEHKAASILLPLLGGLGRPGALPVEAAGPAEAGPIAEALTGVARKAGRRVLYGGANGLSERFPVPDSSIDAAAKAGAFPVGGTTEHAANVLSDALDEAGAVKGDVMKQVEKAGLQGPDSANLAQLLRSKAALLRKNTAGTGIPDLYEKIAADIEAAGEGGRLGAQQTENIKQSLQDAARYGMPTEKLLNRARKNIASTVRQANEDAIGADAVTAGTPDAQAASDALVPAKSAYAQLAPAATAAEKGLSQTTKRNAFSLRDTTLAGGHSVPGTIATLLLSKAARTFGPSTLAATARVAAAVTGGPAARALVLRGVPQDVAEQLAAELEQRSQQQP